MTVCGIASASSQRALYLRLFSAILGGRYRANSFGRGPTLSRQWKSLKHPAGITGR